MRKLFVRNFFAAFGRHSTRIAHAFSCPSAAQARLLQRGFFSLASVSHFIQPFSGRFINATSTKAMTQVTAATTKDSV